MCASEKMYFAAIWVKYCSGAGQDKLKKKKKMNSRHPLGKASVKLDQISQLDLKDLKLREHDSFASFVFYPKKAKLRVCLG